MALSVILLIGYSIRSHRRLEEAERRYLEHANQGMAPAEGHPETQSSRTQRSG